MATPPPGLPPVVTQEMLEDAGYKYDHHMDAFIYAMGDVMATRRAALQQFTSAPQQQNYTPERRTKMQATIVIHRVTPPKVDPCSEEEPEEPLTEAEFMAEIASIFAHIEDDHPHVCIGRFDITSP